VYAFDASKIIEMTIVYKNVFILLLFAYIVYWLPTLFKNWYKNTFISLPLWLMIMIVVIVVFGIYQFQTFELQPFIYF